MIYIIPQIEHMITYSNLEIKFNDIFKRLF